VRALACGRGERVVLAEVGFALHPGGALLLRGANGAGKSTLLRTLAGLLPPLAGQVEGLEGARLAFLGHADGLKPALSVRESVDFAARLAGRAAPEDVLAAYGLEELSDLPTRMLSAGQRRRTALATVLAAQATLWLLDEPTTGLDDASVARFERAVARHRAQGGMVVAATHAPLDLPGAQVLTLAAA
jgi:heme exporter protein A